MILTHNTRATITAVLAGPAMFCFFAALLVGSMGEPSKGVAYLVGFLVLAITALFFAPQNQ